MSRQHIEIQQSFNAPIETIFNILMEYVVSKGSPIKNHKGRMEFSEKGRKTELCYFIDFEPRAPFTLLGSLLKSAIEKPIRQSLEKLSKRYDS